MSVLILLLIVFGIICLFGLIDGDSFIGILLWVAVLLLLLWLL